MVDWKFGIASIGVLGAKRNSLAHVREKQLRRSYQQNKRSRKSKFWT
jgi:hypothetical protein